MSWPDLRKTDPMDVQADDLPRVIPLEGGSNLRDLGGWPTGDGRRVRFGRVFRSAALNGLTDADVATLDRLGIAVVCDFRGEGERARWPSRLGRAEVYELTIAPTIGASLRDLVANARATPDDVVAVMQQAYAAYALDWHHCYRTVFDLLLADDAPPLLFHCTAGKDRTGFGAALILSALGVAEEAIWEDYLATNRLWQGETELANALPPAVGRMLLSAHRDFLAAAFAAIAASHGDMDSYLADRMGLTAARRAALRSRLLEPADAD
jgi:protein-tyrosine phosphatase